ncbi:MAG: SRPBCC family protein [Rudaea sp.]|nr:SRPBCC family protein [Rudaea sp.]
MKGITAVVCIALSTFSAASSAAAPVLKVTRSITVDAPASAVWSKTKSFAGLNAWHPAVDTDRIVEGKDDQVGAVRLLTLKGGGTIKEKLLAFSDSGRTFKYTILEGVLPVSAYTSAFTVKTIGKDKCEVIWSGEFKRKNTGENPGDNENDKTATDTVAGVYQSGLDNLKKIAENK